MNARTTQNSLLALSAAALIALTGCSTPASDASEGSAAPAAESVTMENGWVKAAESGMSAAFGELENTGSGDITVVSATTDAASALELHETVENEAGEMIMREKTGGFTIEAGGSLSLEPGGNHLMLMDLTRPILAGDDVTFTLTFSDDSTYEFTVPAKDYAGANENYEGDDAAHMEEGEKGSTDVSDRTEMEGRSE